jgi:chemotaxis protein methyltransferase WspC
LTSEPLRDDISAVADWLAGYSGISTGIIGAHSLRRAIQLRLQSTGISDIEAYRERLLVSTEEQQSLVELVVVPETWFFRDRHPFVHLRDHVGRLIQDGLPSQPLRLLSAPCATGEEPYSMAMTLLDMGLPRESFVIDAIDICRQSIRKARNAVYGKHSFRGVSEAEKHQHFQITPQGLALHPAIKQTVHFKRTNLMSCLAEMGTRYDVIFCRNLLIYLEETASQHLLESFAALLKPGGLLFVGSAETGKVPAALFSPIRESFVFGFLRNQPEAAAPPPEPPAAVASSPPRRERSVSPRPPRRTPLRSSPRAGLQPALAARSRPATAAAPAAAAGSSREPQAGGSGDTDLERCQQELAQNPYSDLAYLRLGQLLERHNRSEEALDCLQKCLYLKPDSREALAAMIQITKQLGQLDRSRQFQGRLARLQP